jgi:diketogulonate reductase-like aldo/keto reductase
MAGRRMPLMAYSPVEQGRLPASGGLDGVARRLGASRFQVALAWLLQRPGVVAIPKSGKAEHVSENRRALDVALDAEDLAAIDAAFPPPRRKRPLDMI